MLYNVAMLSDNINGSGMRTHLTSEDWSASALVAGIVMLALTLWPYPIPHPCVWGDLAVAAGLKPPSAEFPGLAPLLMHVIFDRLGAGGGLALNLVGAHLLAGLTAGLWCFVFRQLLEFAGRLDMADNTWNRKICPAFSAAGALLVAFSEPVWTASQALSSAGVGLFLAAFAFTVLLRFIARGKRQLGVLAFLAFGLLGGDTPFGMLLLLPVVVLLVLSWRMIDARDDIEPGVRLPPIEEFPWLMMILAWAVGVGITFAIADSSFRAGGGDPGEFSSMLDSWTRLLGEDTTLKGALIGAAVTFVPLTFMVAVFPRLTYPDAPRPILLRMACLLVGVIAVAQLSDVEVLRYRTWTQEDEAVATSVLPGLFMVAAAAAAVLSAAAFAAMAWCHETRSPLFLVKFGRLLVAVAVIAAVVSAGYGRQCREVRQKLAKVDAHIVKTLEECKGRDVISSHGRLDVMLELRARSQGRKLTIVKDGE